MHFAFGVDTTLLNSSLAVVRLAIFCADITIILYSIAAKCPADLVGHRFLWAVCIDNAQVSGFMSSWECCDWDEEHSVGTKCGWGALCQMVNFIGSLPVGTI